jgi:FkbM family methyltransferase
MSLPKEELHIYSKLSEDFKVVFDIGCRDDLDYYEVKKDCEYHLFEPNSEALASIKKKMSSLSDHHIILNEFGLSDERKDDCVYYKNVQSFIPHWCLPSYDSGERFSLRKLDDYVKEKNIAKIDFIKIDVEGLDYQVILGGLDAIKRDNKVSYIQIENSGGNRQYLDLLTNFQFYLMMEPVLLKVLETVNNTDIDFNKFLVKLDVKTADFLDKRLAGTGAGANILGVHTSIDEAMLPKELFLPITTDTRSYGLLARSFFFLKYRVKELLRKIRRAYKMLVFTIHYRLKRKS